MGEKETSADTATGRVAGTSDPGSAGLAIGDEGTTETPHGGGGGGGGGHDHGPLFPHGGELPTHPGTASPADLAGDSGGGSERKGPNAVNVKLA